MLNRVYNGSSNFQSSLALLVICFLVLSSFLFPLGHFASSQTPPLLNVAEGWSGGGGIPGDTNAPFYITLQYGGSGSAYSIQLQANLASTILTNSTGGTLADSYVPGVLTQGGVGNATLDLSIKSVQNPPSVIYVPVTITYDGGANSENLNVPVRITTPNQLSVISTSWSSASSSKAGGIQGDRNDSLNIQILNTNPVTIRSLSGTISVNTTSLSSPSGGATETVSLYSAQGIAPNQLATISFALNVAINAPIGSTQVGLSLTFQDVWGGGISQGTSFSVPIFGLSAISVVPISSTVQIGGISTVSFRIQNSGQSVVYSPVVSLKPPGQILVTGNLTTPSRSAEIDPGASILYAFNVTTSSSAALTTYPASLSVNYTDQFSIARHVGFRVGLTVVGVVQLVVQTEQVTQNLNNVTVTGMIVNYGSAPAALTNVYAYLNSTTSSALLGTQSTYVGTIVPRAPAFFTVVVPYTAQNSQIKASLTLSMVFQNGPNVTQTIKSTSFVNLLAASSLPDYPGAAQLHAIEGAIVAVVVAVGLASFFFLRRRKMI